MKSNQVSVLVVLLLCLVMGGFLYVVDRSSDDEKGWSPSELYGELGARSYEGSSFSDVTFSGGASSDGVAVSMRNGSFSLRTRARHASSPNSLVANGGPGKSVDFLGALSPNRPIASSPSVSGGGLISHMTSSAEFHSFGGGSNMAMGSYTSSSTSLIASSPSSPIALSPNSLITSSPNNLIAYSPSNGEVQVAAEQALMSASSSASGLFGGMMTSYGTASYDQTIYDSYGSTPSGIRGRQSASESDPWFSTMWWNWLDWQYSDDETASGGWGTNKDGTWYFSHQDAEAAYNAWRNYMLSSGMVPNEDALPSYDDWLAWFMTTKDNPYAGGYGTYQFVPLGNVIPLLLLAFVYAVFIFIRRRLGVILEKSNS